MKKTRTPLLALLSVLVLAAMARGQVRDIVFFSTTGIPSPQGWNGLFRIGPFGGTAVPLWVPPGPQGGQGFFTYSLCMLPGNRQYAMIGGETGSQWPGGTAPYAGLHVVDRDTSVMSLVRAFPPNWLGSPYSRALATVVDQEGDILVAGYGLFRVRVSDGSYAVQNLGLLASRQVLVDMDTGDYITDGGPLRVTPQGVATTIGSGNTFLYTQDPESGDFVVGIPSSSPDLWRLSATGVMTRVGPGFEPFAVDREGVPARPYVGFGYALNPFRYDLLRMDRVGTFFILTGYPGAVIRDAVLDRSLNVSTKNAGAPNRWDVIVDFPNDPGKLYACFVGMSGVRPGIPLPGGRLLLMNPDDLTWAVLAGALPNVFQGLWGRLDSRGAAQGRIDLSFLPPGARGRTFWLLAVALDPAAPSGIAAYSDPWVMQIR